MENNDQQLLDEYFSGDLKSLDILIARYLPLVYRLIFCYVKNAADTEDLTQETFVKAWRHLKSFDKQRSFKNWVLIIAKNTTLDFLRKKKDLPLAAFNEKYVDDLLGALTSAEIEAQDLVDFNMSTGAVKEVLENAGHDTWLIFSWYYLGGFNLREIAAKLHKPLNTVKSQYRRALLLVQNNLKH